MLVKVSKVPNLSVYLQLNLIRLNYSATGRQEPRRASLLQLAGLLAVSRVFSPGFTTIYLSQCKPCLTSLMIVGYYNYFSWMQIWAAINQNGTGESTSMTERPQAVAMLYDNTTVQGS